ncbi:MAG TPA: hypothetical protein VMT00_17125, partial [Thermoanaerobaculia bacterium]|nr:hypothetical protein [Thermoanaerobaculia bacterium]
IVIQRFLMDYRDHQWGRWRPSAEARRLGERALLLEQLTERDGYSFVEACQTIRQRYPEVTEAQLEELRFALPQRVRRARAVAAPESVLASVRSDRVADDRLLDQEREQKAARVCRAFQSSLAKLSAEERLILRMRFVSGLKVVTIAQSLQLDQKRLYKTLDRLMSILRAALENEGLGRGDIAELIEHGAEGIEIEFLTSEQEIERTDPSNVTAKGATSGESRPE